MEDGPDIQAVRAALTGLSAVGGFNRWLGVALLRCDPGTVEIAAPIRPEIMQHHGFVHGGVVGALADTAIAWTAATAVGDVVTAGYTLQLLAPATGTRIVAAGEVLKAGRTQVSVQAKVWAEDEAGARKLVAVALAAVARARGAATS